MSLKPFKDVKVIEIGCSNPDTNSFYAKLDDGRTVTAHQPRRADKSKQRRAWKEVSEQSRQAYRRAYVNQDLYDMNRRCGMPLYKGEFPGILPLSLEVDGVVVGFFDIFFKLGSEFKRFMVEDDDKCANGSITALDKYRGIGVGNLYAVLSNYIAKHFGCQYILGRTKQVGGMRGIRREGGWQIVGYDGIWVDHIKRLD